MRLMPLISSALVLAMSGTSFAQEWADFAAKEDAPLQPTSPYAASKAALAAAASPVRQSRQTLPGTSTEIAGAQQ